MGRGLPHEHRQTQTWENMEVFINLGEITLVLLRGWTVK